MSTVARAENAVQLVGGRDFQLIVAAVLRALVWTPAQDCRYDQLEVTPAYELDGVFGCLLYTSDAADE